MAASHCVPLVWLGIQDDEDSGGVQTEWFCALKFGALPPASVELPAPF